MRMLFTRLSNDRHRLQCIRDDGTEESADLETKSLLFHDFLHYAIETEAGLTESFWGLVAAGYSFVTLSGKDATGSAAPAVGELGVTEMVVGVCTGLLKQKEMPEEFFSLIGGWFSATGVEVPAYLTPDFLLRVKERMRHIEGRWNATPFGETFELHFP